MNTDKHGLVVLCLAILLILTACANPQVVAPAPEPAAADLLPTYDDDHTALPWTRYRLALYRPDPEHNTLEAEVPPDALIPLSDDEGIETDDADGAPSDIWDRIRAGYAFPAQDNTRIQTELTWYARHPDYIARTVERARPYLRFIVDAIDQRGMPMELVLLPIVESAFQPFAYSHGRAAGLWQFIPATGKRFGLEQNWWYDGRRDVVASTRAALDYLEYLNGFFDGDWMLALAAYNSGEGTVRRAVTRNHARGLPEDYWSLGLPRETRAYVPKLIALAEIFARPEEYGIVLESVADEPLLAVVPTGSQIDLARAAELAGISLEELYRLNPGFNRWATNPDGPHELLLPIEKTAAFEAGLAQLGDERRVTWTRHLIREGETLGQIAQRYETTVAVLRQINNVKGHMIRAGHSMVIPVAMKDIDSYTLSSDQRRTTTQDTARGDSQAVHLVRSGDTLWDISRKHRVGVRQLAQWNAMAPGDVLRPGQRLVIWKKGASVTAGAGDALNSAHPLNDVTQRINYVVRKGDSLSRISQRFNVRVADLRRWNSLTLNEYLQPGQRLTLYVDITRQTANL